LFLSVLARIAFVTKVAAHGNAPASATAFVNGEYDPQALGGQ